MKKIYKVLLFIFLALGIVYFLISFLLVKEINKIADKKMDQVEMVDKGILPQSKLPAHKLDQTICTNMPFKVLSEKTTIAEVKIDQDTCEVTYQGQKLWLSYREKGLQEVIGIFNHPAFGDLRELSPQKKYEMIMELKKPELGLFLDSVSEIRHGLLYILGSFHPPYMSWEKFYSKDFIIYVIQIEEPRLNKVELFSDKYLMSCLGDNCLEYLQQIGVI